MLEVYGREYPLWSQFVERKTEWIGGHLWGIAKPEEVA